MTCCTLTRGSTECSSLKNAVVPSCTGASHSAETPEVLGKPLEAALHVLSEATPETKQAMIGFPQETDSEEIQSQELVGISLVRLLKHRRAAATPRIGRGEWKSEMQMQGSEWKSESEARALGPFASEGGNPLPSIGGRQPRVRASKRRNSQSGFAERSQTAIIFDWDDTLFPTSYLRDEVRIRFSVPLHEQFPQELATQIAKQLAECECRAANLLTKAHQCGHVAIVTLANDNWVAWCCRQWFPRVGELLTQLNIAVVYANEFVSPGHWMENLGNEAMEKFWGAAKGRAMASILDSFYSQYQGQSWKNVLSVGDSQYEMYGLLAAGKSYLTRKYISEASSVWSANRQDVWQRVEEGHVMNMRAKCCKLLDLPSIEELTVELQSLEQWLGPMVKLDGGFHLELESIDSEASAELVEAVLCGNRSISELPAVHASYLCPES